MRRLSHSRISNWKPDNQERENQPALLNTSFSVEHSTGLLLGTMSVFHQLPQSSLSGQPANSQAVECVCARRAWQCFHTLIAAIQLCVGLAVGHTISTVIDWQEAHDKRQQDRVSPTNPGEEAAPLQCSLHIFCRWNVADARIKASVC